MDNSKSRKARQLLMEASELLYEAAKLHEHTMKLAILAAKACVDGLRTASYESFVHKEQ